VNDGWLMIDAAVTVYQKRRPQQQRLCLVKALCRCVRRQDANRDTARWKHLWS